ncbi:MAG: hypothetical protein PHD67_03645 [Oscillospiraceae bacterium]|nr:hypothetical protein [Oscillospiraceae bacterium]
MSEFLVPEEKIAELSRLVSQRTGIPPEELRQKLDLLLDGRQPMVSDKVMGILNNPQMVEALLRSEKVQQLLRDALGGR